MAKQPAVAGQRRNLEAEAPARRRVGVHVQDLERGPGIRECERQVGDELVAERALLPRVDEKARAACCRRQLRRSAAAGSGAGGSAGRRPVAMKRSVSGGTSPTTVTW